MLLVRFYHSILDMNHPIRVCSQLFVMRHDDERLVHLVSYLEKEGVQFFLVLGIEASRRFVGEDNRRVIDKRTGYRYPLLFSAG